MGSGSAPVERVGARERESDVCGTEQAGLVRGAQGMGALPPVIRHGGSSVMAGWGG